MAALLVDGCAPTKNYDVTFLNDMAIGHLAFESYDIPIAKNMKTNYIVVGGGVAGMSAAYQLRHEDFMLFELSDLLGGSSAGSSYKKTPLCHGAHYDLSYPNYYGPEVLQMLKELKIIYHDRFSNSWKFVDKQFLIPKNRESQTFAHGNFRKDVLPDGETKTQFIELMKSYAGKMPMPTRLIDEEYRFLNTITFHQWLRQHFSIAPEFAEGLDYHMKDDYGAGADRVSALAGIHYFACRPYYTQPVELFSPPEGNSYFINKIHEHLPKESIFSSHLVKMINERNSGFEVQVVDAKRREVIQVECEKIVYAGHKHSLKYIYPRDFHLFQKTEYAPWVVVNFVLNSSWENDTFWQNEIISNNKTLLGFVDSNSQLTEGNRVLTVYYCFKPEEREMMSLLEEKKQGFIEQTLSYLEQYFDRSLKSLVEKVFIKQMGHAMPIPGSGYLFQDANMHRYMSNLVYAGVDNGRLPLLLEAIDSGICAVKEMKG